MITINDRTLEIIKKIENKKCFDYGVYDIGNEHLCCSVDLEIALEDLFGMYEEMCDKFDALEQDLEWNYIPKKVEEEWN